MSRERAGQLVEAGLWLQMSGDLEGAKRLFEQALTLDPQHTQARQLIQAASTIVGVPAAQQAAANLFDMDWSAAAELLPPPEEAPEAEEQAPARTSAWDSRTNPGVHISELLAGSADAMDLLTEPDAPAPPEPPGQEDPDREEVMTLLEGARDLLELDDHSGAMELILKAQQLAPADPEVQALRERSEGVLLTMFESRLGPMDARPRVVLKEDEIIWLNLDHRAGFVLAQIDGAVSFEDLFEVCGMSRIDTARILAQLIDEGVISAG